MKYIKVNFSPLTWYNKVLVSYFIFLFLRFLDSTDAPFFSYFCTFVPHRSTFTAGSASMVMLELAVFWWVQTWQLSCGDWAQRTAEPRPPQQWKWRRWGWRNGKHLKFWAGGAWVRAVTCKSENEEAARWSDSLAVYWCGISGFGRWSFGILLYEMVTLGE